MKTNAAPKTSEIADALRRLSQSDTLRDLEARLAAQNAFNLFDAIGVANQELRHSDFLAFLLRPNEAHGLGDAFLKWFLQTALSQSPAPLLPAATLANWDLSDARVVREWQKVDLFITSPQNHLAVVVENKIFTGEHSDQLTRYMETAKAHGHGGPGKILLGAFLTPHGGKASHADYLPIGYEAVCAHLETLCKTGAFSRAASPDVETIVRHYSRMRRKKILGDPEITKICRDLYKEHQAAFDRIFIEINPKPAQRATVFFLKNLITATAKTTTEFTAANVGFWDGICYLHFVPKSWANEAALIIQDSGRRYLYLQAETHPNGETRIVGLIAPCNSNLRERLLDIVQTRFSSAPTEFGNNNGYILFYSYILRSAQSELPQTDEELKEAWQKWVETEGPKFAALIQPGDFPTA